jgi:hypothetical protein
MAGDERVVIINGYGFHDVTDQTCGGRVMSYEEAYRFTLGQRQTYVTATWKPPKDGQEKK